MKSYIKQILEALNIIAFKRSSKLYLSESESYRVVIELSRTKALTIIDGGAHKGDSVVAFSKYAPKSIFYCFEPDPLSVDYLQNKFSLIPEVNIIPSALGAKQGLMPLYINVSRATSSLLDTNDCLPNNIHGLCITTEKIEVPVISIDEFCSDKSITNIDILKLDIQGYEYNALIGAKTTLKNVRIVLIEVWFVEIYINSKLFPDILNFMNQIGFRLYTLCGLHYGDQDQLLWADAIFIHE